MDESWWWSCSAEPLDEEARKKRAASEQGYLPSSRTWELPTRIVNEELWGLLGESAMAAMAEGSRWLWRPVALPHGLPEMRTQLRVAVDFRNPLDPERCPCGAALNRSEGVPGGDSEEGSRSAFAGDSAEGADDDVDDGDASPRQTKLSTVRSERDGDDEPLAPTFHAE